MKSTFTKAYPYPKTLAELISSGHSREEAEDMIEEFVEFLSKGCSDPVDLMLGMLELEADFLDEFLP